MDAEPFGEGAMNWPHLHLMLSHLPVLGAPFLLLLLAWALVRRSEELTRLALSATVLLALVTVPVYLSGEPAEEALARLPGVSEQVVDRHEARAETGFYAMLATGAVALAAWQQARRRAKAGLLARLALLGLLVSSGVFAWTAWLGGAIRHPEIHATSSPTIGEPGTETEESQR